MKLTLIGTGKPVPYILLWFFVLFYIPSAAAALEASVVVKNFSPGDYGARKPNWSVIQDDRGLMYFANSGGVLEFDSLSWRLIPLSGGAGAYSLAKDRNGRIYVGGEEEIGYLAADSKGKLEYRSLREKIPPPYRAGKGRIVQVGVFRDGSDGVVFLFERLLLILRDNREPPAAFTAAEHFYGFVFFNGALYVIDDTRGLLELRGDRLAGVPGGELLRGHVLLPFKDNTLLIVTTQRGPVIFDPSVKGDPFRPFDTGESDFFRDNLVSCGVVLDGYRVVLGSIEKGIALFRPGGEEVVRTGPAQGLQDKHVYAVYRDAAGDLWAGLARGISFLRSPLFQTYNASPGVAGGTAEKSIPFAALIRGCYILSDDSVVLDGAFYTVENKIQSSRQREYQIAVFPYAYNGVRFTFSSNNYAEIEKTEYQCYLEGLDKGWSNWMDRHSREYTNLYWGEYTFRVRAKNHLGEIGQEASFTFRVTPPWYKTWWFFAGQVVFILMVLIVSRLMDRVGVSPAVSQKMIIFAVIIIFEYVNGFIGPIIGRYSDGIAFFGMLMTGVLSIIISPAQDFVLELMKKIIRGK